MLSEQNIKRQVAGKYREKQKHCVDIEVENGGAWKIY
jgi:hypothetical protein